MLEYNKLQKAAKAKEEKLAKECTFAPQLKKQKRHTVQPAARGPSTGAINLAPIISKGNDNSEFALASEVRVNTEGSEEPIYSKLYKMQKKQIEKTDKSAVDYEFERQQQECTFAP